MASGSPGVESVGGRRSETPVPANPGSLFRFSTLHLSLPFSDRNIIDVLSDNGKRSTYDAGFYDATEKEDQFRNRETGILRFHGRDDRNDGKRKRRDTVE
ncbi:hypothetical protein V2J09_007847 [Rumex salicifolius]